MLESVESVQVLREWGAELAARWGLGTFLPHFDPAEAGIGARVLIVAEASLSYLGLSIPRPEPTWGNMISAGQSDFERYPGLVGIPAIVLFLTVLSFNQLGEAAGRKWSPGAAKI